MVFTKEQNFSKRRPLTDKMMIFDWAWTDPGTIDDAVFLGFKNISITCFLAVKGLTLDQTKLYADKVADFIKTANSKGLQVFTCFHSDNGGQNDPQTNCFFTQDEISRLKQAIDYFMQITKDMNIIYAGWNEPNVGFWSATGGELHGNDPETQISSVNGWIDMEKYIVETSKKYNPNAMNVVLDFAGQPNIWGTSNAASTGTALTVQYANDQGLFKGVDGLAFHPYHTPNSFPYPEQMMFWNGTGTDLPLVTNEYGYSRYGIPGDHWQGDVSMSDAIKFTIRETLMLDYIGYSIEGIYSLVGNSYYMENENTRELNGLAYAMKGFLHEMDGYALDRWINKPTPNNLTTMEYVAVYKKDYYPDKVLYWKCYDDHTINTYNINGQYVELHFSDHVKIQTLEDPHKNLDGYRPLTDKIGGFGWAMPPDDGSAPNYDMKKQIDMAVEMNLKYVTLTMWIFMGPDNKPKEPDWNRLDEYLDLMEQHNMTALFVIAATGDQGAPHNNLGDTLSNWSKENLGIIYGYVEKCIKRYSNRKVIWNGWNEPNANFWNYAGDNFTRTVQWAIQTWVEMDNFIRDTARKYNPSALVAPNIAGTFFYPPKWGPDAFNNKILPWAKEYGLFKNIDGMCYHNYTYDSDPGGCGYSYKGLPEFLAKTSISPIDGLPVLSGEFGYPEPNKDNWQGDFDMDTRINYYLRSILVQDYCKYAIIDFYAFGSGGTYNITNEPDYHLNPVGEAIKELTIELDGYTLSRKVTVTGYADADIVTAPWALMYTKDGSPDKLVYWSTEKELYNQQVGTGDSLITLNFKSRPQIETLSKTRILDDMAKYKYNYLGFTPNPTPENGWAAKTMLCGSQDGINWNTIAWLPKLDNLRDMQVTHYKDWYYIIGTLQIWRTKDFVNFDWVDTGIFTNDSLEFIWAPEIFADKDGKYHIILTATNKGDDIMNGTRKVLIFDIDLDTGAIINPWQQVGIDCGNDIDAGIYWYNNKYYCFMSHDHIYTSDSYLGPFTRLNTNLPDSPNASDQIGYVEGPELLQNDTGKYLFDDRVNDDHVQYYVRRTALNNDLTSYSDFTPLICDGGTTLMRHGAFWSN